MRTTSGLATTVVFLMASTARSWAQRGSPSAAPGDAVSTIVTLSFLALIVVAIVVGSRYVVVRRKRFEDAMILQSHLTDALAREARLSGLHITPTAHISGWRQAHVTVAVAGEVPTSELRETVMQIARAEALRLRPDAVPEDRLFIVPSVRRAS